MIKKHNPIKEENRGVRRAAERRRKKTKRLISLFLAAVLCVAFTIPALAEELNKQEAVATETEPTPEQPVETPTPVPEPTPEPTVPPVETAPPAIETEKPSPTPSEPTPAPSEQIEQPKEKEASVETPAPVAEEPAAELEEGAPEEPENPSYGEPAIFTSGIKAKGSDKTIALSEEKVAEIEARLPEGLTPLRKEIVFKAYSLIGNVKYFWGGKSTSIGWDNRWGNEAIVGSEGSTQTGTTRIFGTDCSGYVLWCMINASRGLDENSSVSTMIDQIGYGTASQWSNSEEIAKEEAIPGDILFYKQPSENGRNHIGIVVGTNEEGNLLVCHNSSSRNGVVIDELKENSGFQYARRFKIVSQNDKEVQEAEEARIAAEEQLAQQKAAEVAASPAKESAPEKAPEQPVQRKAKAVLKQEEPEEKVVASFLYPLNLEPLHVNSSQTDPFGFFMPFDLTAIK